METCGHGLACPDKCSLYDGFYGRGDVGYTLVICPLLPWEGSCNHQCLKLKQDTPFIPAVLGWSLWEGNPHSQGGWASWGGKFTFIGRLGILGGLNALLPSSREAGDGKNSDGPGKAGKREVNRDL